MSLGLKQLIRSNSSGSEIWITDNTLQYVNPTNLTGWGNAGDLINNPHLSQAAILALVYQTVPSEDGTTSSKVYLSPLTSDLAYNVGNADTVQQSIGFGYNTDGHYTCVLFMLPVSTDDTSTLSGYTLVVDDYYYKSGAVYKKTAGAPLLITDHTTLEAISSIVKVSSDVAFFIKLSLKKQLEYYREYRDARNGNDPDLANELRIKMDDLEADLSGCNWNFAAGLFTQLENDVAELLEKHEIPTP